METRILSCFCNAECQAWLQLYIDMQCGGHSLATVIAQAKNDRWLLSALNNLFFQTHHHLFFPHPHPSQKRAVKGKKKKNWSGSLSRGHPISEGDSASHTKVPFQTHHITILSFPYHHPPSQEREGCVLFNTEPPALDSSPRENQSCCEARDLRQPLFTLRANCDMLKMFQLRLFSNKPNHAFAWISLGL